MARIRTVKIGFFRNEDLAVFSFAHRLLFEGLWLLADKRGLLEDRPKRIHADLFPFDRDLDVDAMLTELSDGENPFIQRYEVNGRRYIAVLNFAKHQRPHHTEPPSAIPSPENWDALNPPDDNGDSPLDDGAAQDGREGNGDRKGKEGKGEAQAPDPAVLQTLWNDGTSEPIPQCRELSQKRKVSAIARLRERAVEQWRIVIAKINASSFCRGENDRAWIASFDWLLKPDTAVKVLEGKYDNRVGKRTTGHQSAPAPRMDFSWEAECAELHGNNCGNKHMHAAKMKVPA